MATKLPKSTSYYPSGKQVNQLPRDKISSQRALVLIWCSSKAEVISKFVETIAFLLSQPELREKFLLFVLQSSLLCQVCNIWKTGIFYKLKSLDKTIYHHHTHRNLNSGFSYCAYNNLCGIKEMELRYLEKNFVENRYTLWMFEPVNIEKKKEKPVKYSRLRKDPSFRHWCCQLCFDSSVDKSYRMYLPEIEEENKKRQLRLQEQGFVSAFDMYARLKQEKKQMRRRHLIEHMKKHEQFKRQQRKLLRKLAQKARFQPFRSCTVKKLNFKKERK